LTTEAFYYNRSDLIEERLSLIERSCEGATSEHALYASPVKDMLTHTWNAYNGNSSRNNVLLRVTLTLQQARYVAA